VRLTNNANLPSPLVKAILNDGYDRGACDFTVTELLQPPRARALVAQHYGEITEDAADMIWRLVGQIGHAILERAADPTYSEHRFYGKVAGKMISGRADLHFDGGYYHIWDYKFTSMYTVREGIKPEWEQQVNMLRWLAVHHLKHTFSNQTIRKASEINRGSICVIYRDWYESLVGLRRDYPMHGVQVFPVKLWPLTHTQKFMEGRVRAHLASKHDLPLCTDEERWFNAKKGEYKRCRVYCRAYPFCKQANPALMEEPI